MNDPEEILCLAQQSGYPFVAWVLFQVGNVRVQRNHFPYIPPIWEVENFRLLGENHNSWLKQSKDELLSKQWSLALLSYQPPTLKYQNHLLLGNRTAFSIMQSMSLDDGSHYGIVRSGPTNKTELIAIFLVHRMLDFLQDMVLWLSAPLWSMQWLARFWSKLGNSSSPPCPAVLGNSSPSPLPCWFECTTMQDAGRNDAGRPEWRVIDGMEKYVHCSFVRRLNLSPISYWFLVGVICHHQQ